MTQTSQRRRARELVLQGLYQRQLSGNGAREVREDLVTSPGYLRADHKYFDELWRGVVDDYDALEAAVASLRQAGFGLAVQHSPQDFVQLGAPGMERKTLVRVFEARCARS